MLMKLKSFFIYYWTFVLKKYSLLISVFPKHLEVFKKTALAEFWFGYMD